jgi:hypothetical protein
MSSMFMYIILYPPRLHTRRLVLDVQICVEAETREYDLVTPGNIKPTLPEAVVGLTKNGEAPVKVTSGSPLSLTPGTYTPSARIAVSSVPF